MRQNELEPALNALFKAALLTAVSIKTCQRFDISAGQRSSVSPARDSRQDRARTRQFLSRGCGPARKNFVAARCLLGGQSVHWTLDSELADLRRLHDAFDRIVIENASPVRLVQ